MFGIGRVVLASFPANMNREQSSPPRTPQRKVFGGKMMLSPRTPVKVTRGKIGAVSPQTPKSMGRVSSASSSSSSPMKILARSSMKSFKSGIGKASSKVKVSKNVAKHVMKIAMKKNPKSMKKGKSKPMKSSWILHTSEFCFVNPKVLEGARAAKGQVGLLHHHVGLAYQDWHNWKSHNKGYGESLSTTWKSFFGNQNNL